MDSVDKWNNVCRLCAEEKNEMLPIFGNEGLQRKVAQKLRACLPVLVYKTDPLPKQICQFCAARLDDVYEFREYCLNVYKNMHAKLLMCRTESVKIFLDAMKNSPDPCQAQLCKEKSRALPPLVPLPASLPFDDSVMLINHVNQDQLQNACMETLSELPCEVEIKEMNADPIVKVEAATSVSPNTKCKLFEIFDTNMKINTNISMSIHDMGDEQAISKAEYQKDKEEKHTSILEQVLTGNLTMNNRQELEPKRKLSSEWWCSPCNNYYKTKEGLVKHMQLHCPRIYTCRKCSLSFESVEHLAKHEAISHLKVTLDFAGSLKDCHQCDRRFVSWEMLRQHRLRDHLAELSEIGTNTWCSLCNRFFPTIETYQNHIQLHQTNYNLAVPEKPLFAVPAFPTSKTVERSREIKKGEQVSDNVKSLQCPTCGKVCTQQSALSNHMRTHQPKRHKCDICGRSFGLFIRLTAHRMAEHNMQPTMSPILSAVEQEEALNAEREAREAREARTRNTKITKSYTEILKIKDVSKDEEFSLKCNSSGFKNVARCGICLEWFSDHTTMLTHLQTHSENYTCKNYICHTCKKSFKEKWQLLRHKICHKRVDDDSIYTCTICNKSFLRKTAYKAHQKTHVDKSYHCIKCNKIFSMEISLLNHLCTDDTLFTKRVVAEPMQKTSHDIRKYKCSKCNSSFTSLQSRTFHMKMHAEDIHNMPQTHEIKIKVEDESMPKLHPETSLEYNISPIEPKIEINVQSAPPPLKRTLIRTTGGFRCGVCQSPFVLRELAVAHLRSAHPVMPYQCPYCKKRFTTQYMFTHHIKTDHPDEPEK